MGTSTMEDTRLSIRYVVDIDLDTLVIIGVLKVGQMYGAGGNNHRHQERIILVKNEPQVQQKS